MRGGHIIQKIKRPALRWHGGKWNLAQWIVGFFPQHRIYVEPYGGAASVLLQKAPVHSEVYNDLDDEVVNFFRVIRDPQAAAELERKMRLTPFARSEFETAYPETPPANAVERARLLVVRSFMGFGSDSHNKARATGFRSNARNAGTSTAVDWSNLPANIPALTERFRGVIIERKPAIEVMRFFDGPTTLHYVDPPYVMSTRSATPGKYSHEMLDSDHRQLASVLRGLQGFVVLSGYESLLYSELYAGWQKHQREVKTNGGHDKTEWVWLNARAAEAHQGLLL